jgi:anti-sigma regulatory factor (Ser/Thr protein kinase)
MTILVPGTLEGLAQALRAAEAFCTEADAPRIARDNVMTVLDEILANIVHHGLANTHGTIELTMEQTDGRLIAGVVDSAPPFDPLQMPMPDTTLPLEQRKIGGLGIVLVRALTNDIAYDFRNGRNHLTLTWHLDTEASKDRNANQ